MRNWKESVTFDILYLILQEINWNWIIIGEIISQLIE